MNMLRRAYGNTTTNDKGARSYKSTLDPVLDYYSKSGALRGNQRALYKLFANAYNHDSLLALKAMFHMRDIRGGNGERQSFRDLLMFLEEHDPDALQQNLQLIPMYGRWDDLFVLIGTSLEADVIKLIDDTLVVDMKNARHGDSTTLLAKWLPSENASSKATRRIAKKIRSRIFGVGNKAARRYRKMLSHLRQHINVTERLTSANKWDEIDYETIPSGAHFKYRRAFARRTPDRYTLYMNKVKRGEAKINASTMFPYDLVRATGLSVNGPISLHHLKHNDTVEAQWRALPNHMDGQNMLVIADTSGSMFNGFGGNKLPPILVSVSLAIYAAERNTGPFKNAFMNFSGQSDWQELRGRTLVEKLRNIKYAHYGNNTNLAAAFENLLITAVEHNVPAEDMPSMIVIISDMQFDRTQRNSRTNHSNIKRMYEGYGYTKPVIVYWNVNASKDTPVTKDENGVILVSGASTNAFKAILSADVNMLEEITPYQLMLQTLNSDRYIRVRLGRPVENLYEEEWSNDEYEDDDDEDDFWIDPF